MNHLERAIAHLTEHGETRGGALSAALGIAQSTLVAALRVAIDRDEIRKRNEGRAAYYRLASDLPQPTADASPAIRWTIWDDGDLVVYGLQENEDGSHTIPASTLEAIKRRVAWSPT